VKVVEYEDIVAYEVEAEDKLVAWSCKLPESVLNALRRYSQRTGIPQARIAADALRDRMKTVGAL
jgi:hypothetical protein